jgi:predicted kinase
MGDVPEPRSVKISDDERGGWSSDRPRREGSAPRPADISTRCRVLKVTDRLRYTPGSLVLVISPNEADRERFVTRIVEERSAVMSIARVRTLLQGKVDASELDARAEQLLAAAIAKRLGSGDSVVVEAADLDEETRDKLARAAHANRRSAHLILLDTGAEGMSDEERVARNDLRRRLDGGELGQEGFRTALRLTSGTVSDVKRLVFRRPPRDDD